MNDAVTRTLPGTEPAVRRVQHFRRAEERPFTRIERERVTCLFGGLTARHDRLMEAFFRGAGYKALRVPTPSKEDYRTGREYCSPGLCSPAYFTVGALVNFLKGLRDRDGIAVSEIVDTYVFVMPGSCGPCRFGMYESEYRLALLNGGFEGFRVIVIQQKSGLDQLRDNSGLEVTGEFVRAWITALMIGDLFNDLEHQLRPYEVTPGATEQALEAAMARICLAKVGMLRQLVGGGYSAVLAECRQVINAVEVDYTRPKALCKITGEFWAQATEGDGNFRLFSFLESHGAEVVVEPVTTWIVYLLDSAVQRRQAARAVARPGMGVGLMRSKFVMLKEAALLRLALFLVRREYERMRRALGGLPRPLPDMQELRALARPFYNDRITGGEGHMEIGKAASCAVHRSAHLVLSVKPFGCLPSTQSDGVQGAALTHHARLGHHMLFLPVETAGEGSLGFQSRVLMVLEEARALCAEEFQRCLKATGCTLEAMRAWCREHDDLRRPFQAAVSGPGTAVSRAARFVQAVASDAGAAAIQGRASTRERELVSPERDARVVESTMEKVNT